MHNVISHIGKSGLEGNSSINLGLEKNKTVQNRVKYFQIMKMVIFQNMGILKTEW